MHQRIQWYSTQVDRLVSVLQKRKVGSAKFKLLGEVEAAFAFNTGTLWITVHRTELSWPSLVRATTWCYVRYFSLELLQRSRSCRSTCTRSFASQETILFKRVRPHTVFLVATIWSSFTQRKRCIVEKRLSPAVVKKAEVYTWKQVQTIRLYL